MATSSANWPSISDIDPSAADSSDAEFAYPAMPAPLLILCPLRSFSSVVCAMLGQHPQTYGMPELNLFLADPLWRWLRFTRTRMPHGRDGLLRALAELHHGEQTVDTIEDAKDWLKARLRWSTKEVFDHLLDAVSPRLAIDKSPSTVMHRETMESMHAMYPEARYLHLTRHPGSYGRSLVRFAERSGQWGRSIPLDRIDPERVWLRAHRRILELTEALPEGQSMRVRGEDILARPDAGLSQILAWLGLDRDPHAIESMKHPERSPYACVGPANAEGGSDPDFLDNPVFSEERRHPDSAELSLDDEYTWARSGSLSPQTVSLAQAFGYS